MPFSGVAHFHECFPNISIPTFDEIGLMIVWGDFDLMYSESSEHRIEFSSEGGAIVGDYNRTCAPSTYDVFENEASEVSAIVGFESAPLWVSCERTSGLDNIFKAGRGRELHYVHVGFGE